jgi:phage gp36-like protein
MSYCTEAQLIDRFGEATLIRLTDRGDPPAGTIDAAVVDRAVADTDALIDGYLKGRYALPLSETPALLTDLALVIAIYKLHVHVAEDKIRRDYEDAMRTLREIAAGTVRLDVAGAEPAASGTSGVRTNAAARPLSAATMKGFV